MRWGIAQVAWLVAACGVAHADSQQDEADLLFEEGRDLLARQQPAKACARFELAIRLDPDAEGIMLNLGLCNEALGKYKTALYWFRKAEHRATESTTPMPAHERMAKEHAAAAAAKVATISIAFSGDTTPQGVAVKIDGEPVPADDFARVELDPGQHVLTAQAPGLEATQPFRVEGEAGQKITVTLAPTRAAAQSSPAAARDDSSRRPIVRWLAIGGTGALVAAGGLVLYERHVYGQCTTNGMLDTSASGCDHPTDPYAAAVAANDARHVARVYGTGLAVTGAVALGVAAYFYFTRPARREHAAIVPAVARDHVGIALIGEL